MRTVSWWALGVTSVVALAGSGCGGDGGGNGNTNLPTQGVCGDGVLDPAEQCDDGVANSDVEADACRTSCRTAYCGDGVADSPEECDEGDLGDNTCIDLGFDSGTLSCRSDCTYDTRGCGRCGNGILEAEEQCDGSDLGGAVCADVSTWQHGTLRCSADCTFDLSDTESASSARTSHLEAAGQT